MFTVSIQARPSVISGDHLISGALEDFYYDLALTFVLWNALFDLMVWSWHLFSPLSTFDSVTVGPETWAASPMIRASDLFNVYFWNTFLTLSWWILFLVAVGFVRVAAVVQRSFVKTQKVLDLDDFIASKPMATLGYLIAAISLLTIAAINTYAQFT